MAMKNFKKCVSCEMFGGIDSFLGTNCKSCDKIFLLEKKYETIMNMLDVQATKINELKETINNLSEEKECQIIKQVEQFKEESHNKWNEVVQNLVDKKIETVSEKVTLVEKKLTAQSKEDKKKKQKKNNIIMYRMPESNKELESEKIEDDKSVVRSFLKNILKIQCEDNAIKTIRRLGKSKGDVRPLLISFQNLETKGLVFQNLSKLKDADESYRRISIAHDMTINERNQCREQVIECKDKQSKNESGDWIYRVRGPPGAMKVIRVRRL